jgi:hypothetical protein
MLMNQTSAASRVGVVRAIVDQAATLNVEEADIIQVGESVMDVTVTLTYHTVDPICI